MSDGPIAVSAPASASASATTAYARIYEEQQPRLVAYARSLTRNAWTAEDLVAEAHFRVWRRLAAGHEIDNVPAYLMTTVRHLAIAAGSAVRETPRDPHADERAEAGEHCHGPGHGDNPAEQVSSVDLLVRVLGQLPERWVKALWLAEAEGQPLAAIGPQLGTRDGATAVLLHRAREGMRQAFLKTQTGAPDDPACQVHWSRMPAYVRGGATARQSERLLGHVDACDDCRARLAALINANDRLPALVGPALLVFTVGGAGKFLLAFTAGSAGAAFTAGGGHAGGLLHGVRQVAVGGSKAQVAAAGGAVVAGVAAVLLVLGSIDGSTAPAQRTPVADAPLDKVPVTRQPVAEAVGPPSTGLPGRPSEKNGTSTRADGAGGAEQVRVTTGGKTAGAPTDDSPSSPVGTGPGEPDEPDQPIETTPVDPDPAPPAAGGDHDEPPQGPEAPADPPKETPKAPPAPPKDSPKPPSAPSAPSAPPAPPAGNTPEYPAPSAPPSDSTTEPESPSAPSTTPAPEPATPTPASPEPVENAPAPSPSPSSPGDSSTTTEPGHGSDHGSGTGTGTSTPSPSTPTGHNCAGAQGQEHGQEQGQGQGQDQEQEQVDGSGSHR
ncbi:sigma-70 family RNA polymerase sigma factor [Streptomyces sp. NBC_01613]|uniref:sigma-70 family RNA polymerase sigma factor n=1 Tax=Streptomyces sp. NBC_01613 TaxID=2975896 RepID=UPI003870322B